MWCGIFHTTFHLWPIYLCVHPSYPPQLWSSPSSPSAALPAGSAPLLVAAQPAGPACPAPHLSSSPPLRQPSDSPEYKHTRQAHYSTLDSSWDKLVRIKRKLKLEYLYISRDDGQKKPRPKILLGAETPNYMGKHCTSKKIIFSGKTCQYVCKYMFSLCFCRCSLTTCTQTNTRTSSSGWMCFPEKRCDVRTGVGSSSFCFCSRSWRQNKEKKIKLC